ncbi:deuterosome assembly protein 1 isoform X3 [Mirounga leonina]|uniref:deuterosome assembly protein 1 isoform X3 n=1 Tax=Mirounga leonina TaxID=9715 RepID=UPI00156BDF76|nr:deuterosome assembly protein 1 isoform X3 [Mirounga leonina]XP_045750561.1 deuterosome assembly protein 1 isoform X5 [Mirounga angustirostris]
MQHFLDMENQAHNMMGASPCEAELQELMEQIDIMVSNKKLDWERKMRALETRLDLRDQELANAQTCLDQKGQEVGLLRQKLDSLEKCNLAMTQNYEGQLQTLKAQKQAQSYQTQLSGKKQCTEDNSSEDPQLMCDLDHSCKGSERDEFIIEKLKSAVSEIALSRNKLQDENQKLLQELKMYQRQCQAMEAGLSEVKSELQSRDDLLRIIEMERLQLHRELLKIGECQNTQESKKRLESSYSPSTKEPERKRKELFSVTLDQPNHEKELNKIRSQLYQEEEYHGSEQERMRNEISDLTEELHQKEITIATIMKKAALLERQLKMELEIKEKMLAKQQVSDMRYKAVRTENTHLKGMMGDLDPGRYMTNEITDTKSMDFTNREHSRHTSINKLEYENERLRNDLAKLHANGKSAWANQNAYEEMGLYTYQNQIKMEKHEDRLSQDREPNRSVTPPLPPLPFQTKEMTSPLASDDEVFPLSPPDTVFPASLAAQHFLLEEEKRAKEFEKLLNTHIDELQRHTEFTLNKYTKLKQNRHI